ncbi:hypothetical protein [Bosea sp. (in: a-proteobacteria)]|uniref:hypothetical protein n=1 Tax=Bosea sp. (in: a-proteobacteria) TaxID=1871050 RepID=UPI003B3B362F
MYWGTEPEAGAAVSPTDRVWEKPVEFAEAWDSSAAMGRAVKQVVSRARARNDEWERMLGDIRDKTGEAIANPMQVSAGDLGTMQTSRIMQRLSKLRQDRPELGLPEDFDAEIDRRADLTLASAVRDARAVEARPHSWGGLAGGILGDIQTMLSDPVQLPFMVMGAGAARSILGTALIEGGIGFGQSVAVSAATARDRRRVDPQFGLAEAAGEAAAAAVGGAAIGGGFRALSRGLGLLRGSDIPRTLRDAANVAESEAQIASTFRATTAEGEVAQRAGLSNAIDAAVAGQPIQPSFVPVGRTGRVFDAEGRAVDVQYQIADAASLVTSHGHDLTPNPLYPPQLQPRDRSRAGSAEQINEIASRLEPARLGPSSDAATGAPIVGPDGIVESGNGRVLALQRVLEADGQKATQYRAWLEAQGYDIGDIANPVLIARRLTDLDEPERVAFTDAANRATAMRLSPAEQARADARLLDGEILSKAQPGDIASAANRPFVRDALARLPQAERAGLYDQGGALSVEGRRRLEAALTARAYGDADLLAKALEATDNNIRAIGGAMMDAAASWVRMRDAALSGAIPAHMDITADLLDAARLVARARDSGVKVADLAAQAGMFGDEISATGRVMLEAFFHDADMRRPVARAKLGEFLRGYADEAMKNSSDARLFGEPLNAGEILSGLGSRPDLASHVAEAVAPARAVELAAAPEVRSATLQEFDKLRAFTELHVPSIEIDPATGQARTVMRPVNDLVDALDHEERAASLIGECAMGMAA